MGIPDQDCERILQPMARLERDRDSAIVGTGIGLATVQRIAQADNGDLEIAQTPRRRCHHHLAHSCTSVTGRLCAPGLRRQPSY